ncbi:hypothetical protein K3165_05955 [Qipengyuania sp. 1XM1-15A]|uniref:hypothetical protein n=1 Tax=Qipengyuania xiamenensis TaxID=2867237 RepID=UPI001C876CFA|nr:hypothetical protein [Qipengyuania xiamenensis]MBX7532461.1 hypothetical protein [Qipengyuania xiamenensis]
MERSGEAEEEYTADHGRVLSWKIGNVRLCATWPEGNLFDRIVRDAARDASLPHEPLPEGIRHRRRGVYGFYFDYLRGEFSVHPD